jgi:hypothetical protein
MINWRLTSTPAKIHMTMTAVGNAVHTIAPRKPTRARTTMKGARRGRCEESVKKYEP